MMTCTVCTHPEREAIDQALIEGMAQRAIAGRWGLARSSVDRHGVHIAQAIQKANEKRGESALSHATWLVGKLRKKAELCDVGPARQFLAAADTLSRALMVFGRLTGEIRNGSEVSVTVNQIVVPEPALVAEKAVRYLRARGYTVLEPEAAA